MGALELTPNKTPEPFKELEKLEQNGFRVIKEGVMVRAIGDSVAFCPPMIITEDQIDELFEPVERSLKSTLDWAFSEGFLN